MESFLRRFRVGIFCFPLYRSPMNARGEIKTHDIDAAVAALRSGRCTKLRTASAYAWGDADAGRLADALEAGGGAVLRKIDLRGQNIGAAGAARLVAAITAGACPRIETLRLNKYHMDADALTPLGHLLLNEQGEVTTQELGVAVAALRSGRCTLFRGGWCADWGDAGAARLADALAADGGRGGARLRTLHLGGPYGDEFNKVGDAGASGLAAALAGGACPALVTLNLYNNEIGDAGASGLVAALASGACPALATLVLGSNEIGDAAASAFAAALENGACPALATLALDYNDGVSTATHARIAEACKEANRALAARKKPKSAAKVHRRGKPRRGAGAGADTAAPTGDVGGGGGGGGGAAGIGLATELATLKVQAEK